MRVLCSSDIPFYLDRYDHPIKSAKRNEIHLIAKFSHSDHKLFTTAREVYKKTWPTLVISCVRSEKDGLLVYQSRAAQRARQLFTTARDVYKVHNLVHKVVHKVVYIRQVSYTIDLDVRNVGSSKHC